MRRWYLIGGGMLLAVCFASRIIGRTAQPADTWLISPPAGLRPTKIDRAGKTVIPNGRILTPRGRQIIVAPHPFGLVLSPDGTLAVTANGGIEPFSISVVERVTSDRPVVRQIPPGPGTDKGVLASVYMGLAVSQDNRILYVGGGEEGKIILFDPAEGRRLGEIEADGELGGKNYEDSYIGDLALSRDGKLIYALDQANFRLLIASVAERRLVASVRLGRYPFGLALSPDARRPSLHRQRRPLRVQPDRGPRSQTAGPPRSSFPAVLLPLPGVSGRHARGRIQGQRPG